MPNEVGGMTTVLPEEVADKMKSLLSEYNAKENKTLEDRFFDIYLDYTNRNGGEV